MKNEIYDSMLSRYDLTTEQNKRNAIFEVNQQVILAELNKRHLLTARPIDSEQAKNLEYTHLMYSRFFASSG